METVKCGIMECKTNGGKQNCIGEGCQWGKNFKQTNKLRLALHNIIGHPLMEICYLLGLTQLGNYIHNDLFNFTLKQQTIMKNEEEEGYRVPSSPTSERELPVRPTTTEQLQEVKFGKPAWVQNVIDKAIAELKSDGGN